MSSKPANTTTPNDQKNKDIAGKEQVTTKDQFKSLEEDDEFEDFQQEDWDSKDTLGEEEEEEEHLWEETWDDDDNDDDFTERLKAEMKKHEKTVAN